MVRVLRVEVGMARCMLGLRMYRELQVGSGVEVWVGAGRPTKVRVVKEVWVGAAP